MPEATSHRHSLWLTIVLTLCFIHFRKTAAQQVANAGPTMSQQLEAKMMSAALEYVNPEYIGKDSFVKIRRLSRDTPAVLIGFFPLLKDWPREVNFTYTAYRKLSNRWSESYIKGSDLLCDVLDFKVAFHRDFISHCSFPGKCPVLKGNLTINNYYLNLEKMPYIGSLSANQDWKFKLGFVALEDPILIFSYELRFDPARMAHHSIPPRHHN